MILSYVLVYVVSLVVSWYFVNYFADEEDTNFHIYMMKILCLIPVGNTALTLVLLMAYLNDKTQILGSLEKHLADKPFKRKPK